MSIRLNATQLQFLNRIQNQYPGLLEASLKAIQNHAPHLLGKQPPVRKPVKMPPGMGALGASTTFGGTTFGGPSSSTTFNPSYNYSGGTSSTPASTASNTSGFWSGLTGILTAALPTYIAVHAGSNTPQVQGNYTTGQTSSLLSSYGIGTGISSVVLIGGALVAFLLLRKKKK